MSSAIPELSDPEKVTQEIRLPLGARECATGREVDEARWKESEILAAERVERMKCGGICCGVWR